MLTAITGRSLVITHCGTHARDFVGRHTGSDARAVNNNSEIAGSTRNGARNKVRIVRIINRLAGMGSEVLKVMPQICKKAFDLFFHLEPAVVCSECDSLFLCRSSSTQAFQLNASLTDQILRQRSQDRFIIDTQGIARLGGADLVFGDYVLCSLIDNTHMALFFEI